MCEEWYPTPQHPSDRDRNWYDSAAKRDSTARDHLIWYATTALPRWFPNQDDSVSEMKLSDEQIQRGLMMNYTSYMLYQMASMGVHATIQLERYVDKCGAALQDSRLWYKLFSELVVLYPLPAAEAAAVQSENTVDLPVKQLDTALKLSLPLAS